MTGVRTYICIDLKSFYASVECVSRGLDPLNTNLVVADSTRTEKTICLAISPSLKSYGLPGRARLFEVVSKVNEINKNRKNLINNKNFKGESFIDSELKNNPNLKLSFVIAPPRMAYYIEVSSKIYSIYLKYISKEDIHVYSIDEVFMDVTKYLKAYNKTPYELAETMILDVLKNTGVTATAGIGTNMYLAKVAMDIVAKHIPANKDGVRIAELNEITYREKLWSHRPLTDFWRVGRGYRDKLESLGLFTMGDIALCSVGKNCDKYNEDLLYKTFGINAELLIDHAWGFEPTTIEMIKKYQPNGKSMGSGQVLKSPYNFKQARIIVREMIEQLALDMVDKNVVCNQLVLTLGYDHENFLLDESKKYIDKSSKDYLGRDIPRHGHGTVHLDRFYASSKIFSNEILKLYDKIVNEHLLIRRIYVTAVNIVPDSQVSKMPKYEQLNLFEDLRKKEEAEIKLTKTLEKEKKAQKTILAIKRKYGKNAVIKVSNLQEESTAIERNKQIGGHKA